MVQVSDDNDSVYLPGFEVLVETFENDPVLGVPGRVLSNMDVGQVGHPSDQGMGGEFFLQDIYPHVVV